MKTLQHWIDQGIKVDQSHLVAAIQADARAGMIEVSALDPLIEFLEFTRKRMMEYGLTVVEIDGHIDHLKTLRNEH